MNIGLEIPLAAKVADLPEPESRWMGGVTCGGTTDVR